MVYDITRRSSFNHLATWLTDARNHTNPSTILMLVGNKLDLGKQREVSYEEAEAFSKDNGLIYLEVSAKTGQNVEEAFLRTARKIYEAIQSGALDINAADTGVVPNRSRTTKVKAGDGATSASSCSC
jgi:Ras-related protein Rab-14